MSKYLDYEGLKKYNEERNKYISELLGTGYGVAGNKKNVKDYIDSRIFVGTAAEVELALEQKKIDESTFTMVYDENATEVTSISDNEINALFK